MAQPRGRTRNELCGDSPHLPAASCTESSFLGDYPPQTQLDLHEAVARLYGLAVGRFNLSEVFRLFRLSRLRCNNT